MAKLIDRYTELPGGIPVPIGTDVFLKRAKDGFLIDTQETDALGFVTFQLNGSEGFVYTECTVNGTTRRRYGQVASQVGVWYQAEWPRIMKMISGGVLMGIDNSLAVSPQSGLNLQVATGISVSQGTLFSAYTVTVLPITANASGNPRIDTVVVRYVLSGIDEGKTSLAVLTGTPAGSPVAPALTQGAVTWEEPLADLAVANGAGSFVGGNLTDRRAAAAFPIATNSVTPPKLANSGTLSTAETAQVLKAATSGPNVALAPLTTIELDDVAGASQGPVAGDILYRNSDGKYRYAPGLTIASKRLMQLLIRPGSLNPYGYMWNEPPGYSVDGTIADAAGSDGPWLQHTTTAVIGNAAGIIGGQLVRRSWQPELIIRLKTPATFTSLRLWIGLLSASPEASAVLGAIQGSGFRYDTTADGTAFWRCVSSNGALNTTTITTKPIAADTAYTLRVRFETDGGLARTFWVDDELVATHTDNHPSLNTTLDALVRLTTLSAATRNVRWTRVALLHL